MHETWTLKGSNVFVDRLVPFGGYLRHESVYFGAADDGCASLRYGARRCSGAVAPSDASDNRGRSSMVVASVAAGGLWAPRMGAVAKYVSLGGDTVPSRRCVSLAPLCADRAHCKRRASVSASVWSVSRDVVARRPASEGSIPFATTRPTYDRYRCRQRLSAPAPWGLRCYYRRPQGVKFKKPTLNE